MLLMFIPEKLFFGHKYIILAVLNLKSIVNFLLFFLPQFLVVRVVLTVLTRLLYCNSIK